MILSNVISKSNKLIFENKSYVKLAYCSVSHDRSVVFDSIIEPGQIKEISTYYCTDWVIVKQSLFGNGDVRYQPSKGETYDQDIAFFSPTDYSGLDPSIPIKITTNEKFRTMYIDSDLNKTKMLMSGIKDAKIFLDLNFWKTYLLNTLDEKAQNIYENLARNPELCFRTDYIGEKVSEQLGTIFIQFSNFLPKFGLPYEKSKKFLEDFMKMYKIAEKSEIWRDVENQLQTPT